MKDIDLLPEGEVSLYKQAGVIGRLQGSLVALWVHRMKAHFSETYGDIWMYFRPDEDCVWYFLEEPMHEITREFISRAGESFPAGFETKWTELKAQILEESRAISRLDIKALSLEELKARYDRIVKMHAELWAQGIFIDSFDSGDDLQLTAAISERYGLSTNEVETLVTPHEPSYVTAWEKALYKLHNGGRTISDIREEYFWIRSDYHYFAEVDDKFLEEVARKAEPVEWDSPEVEQKAVLAKHQLSKNPLETFLTLTQWRDDRKRYNFVGLYGIMRLLTEAATRQGVEAQHVRNLFPDEAERVFSEKLSKELLESLSTRFDSFSFLRVDPAGNFAHIDGAIAEQAHAKLLKHEAREHGDELKGTVACRGHVQGIARIIPSPESDAAKRFQKGDILITSMTRPEFVPLMKLSGGIVTNEGGITSHAAIVSRELKKPCVIGTKHATDFFVDGELIEVDANKGIVRKI